MSAVARAPSPVEGWRSRTRRALLTPLAVIAGKRAWGTAGKCAQITKMLFVVLVYELNDFLSKTLLIISDDRKATEFVKICIISSYK